jgi:hypothetical protein
MGTATVTVSYSPPKTAGSGGGGHKACGFGAATGASGASTLLALAMVALLLGATTRR